MPYGIPHFEIRDINRTGLGLTIATVAFLEDEGDHETDQGVTHHTTVKVRVPTNDRLTMAETYQILFEKAVQQLRLSLAKADGRTAAELLIEGDQKVKDEAWKPLSEED